MIPGACPSSSCAKELSRSLMMALRALFGGIAVHDLLLRLATASATDAELLPADLRQTPPPTLPTRKFLTGLRTTKCPAELALAWISLGG